MADVKWIKITTDIFDDEKILMIESMPSADSIIVIWLKLLTFAGKQNNDGVFLMSNRIAYTDEMLACIFRRDVNLVRMALKAFEQFGMIEIIENVITIPNWNKHQTLDAYEKKKERDRLYQQERRAAQKALVAGTNIPATELPKEDWKKVLSDFNHQCAYCGSETGLEQEHIVPMKKGGKYELGNIVPACRHCNASKGDRYLIEWYPLSDVFNPDRLHHILTYMKSYDKSSDKSCDKSSDIVVSDKEEDKEKELERDSNKNSARQPSKADVDSFFESVWNLYPVKKGKGQVSDTKRKVLFKIGYDNLERAINRYLTELKKDASWRKPQNGSTFFNSGYVDYLDENYAPDQTVMGGRTEKLPEWFGRRELDDDERLAIQRMMSEDKDNDFQDEAEQLKRELQAAYG